MDKLLSAWMDTLRAAAQRLLILDFDGTLAPFAIDRRAVRVYAGAEPSLEMIRDHAATRLVLVSGRALEELQAVFPFARTVECWGSHGLTRCRPGGATEQLPLEAPVLSGLQQAADRACELGFGDFLERKAGCVALHWRGQTPVAQELMLRAVVPAWQPLCSPQLKLRQFDGGLEIMQQAHDKGGAVIALLREMPQAAAAYLGDDLTDEAAFARIKGRGLGVLVRREPRPTQARVCLKPPEELLEFLQAWAQLQPADQQREAHG